MDDERVAQLQAKIAALRDELREYGGEVEDSSCAALCETSAEVLGGLETAFEHFIDKSEAAWRR